jgi:hypothetical protein
MTGGVRAGNFPDGLPNTIGENIPLVALLAPTPLFVLAHKPEVGARIPFVTSRANYHKTRIV